MFRHMILLFDVYFQIENTDPYVVAAPRLEQMFFLSRSAQIVYILVCMVVILCLFTYAD